MNLQPSEFIATYNMVPGTVVRLRNRIFASVDASKGGLTSGLQPRQATPLATNSLQPGCGGDTTNLPVILFDPLDTDTDTDTSTDKENNNDND